MTLIGVIVAGYGRSMQIASGGLGEHLKAVWFVSVWAKLACVMATEYTKIVDFQGDLPNGYCVRYPYC
jgi:hypothetical protein